MKVFFQYAPREQQHPLFIEKGVMKKRIVITLSQLRKVLETESVRLPLILDMSKLSKADFKALSDLLKAKRKD